MIRQSALGELTYDEVDDLVVLVLEVLSPSSASEVQKHTQYEGESEAVNAELGKLT